MVHLSAACRPAVVERLLLYWCGSILDRTVLVFSDIERLLIPNLTFILFVACSMKL